MHSAQNGAYKKVWSKNYKLLWVCSKLHCIPTLSRLVLVIKTSILFFEKVTDHVIAQWTLNLLRNTSSLSLAHIDLARALFCSRRALTVKSDDDDDDGDVDGNGNSGQVGIGFDLDAQVDLNNTHYLSYHHHHHHLMSIIETALSFCDSDSDANIIMYVK